MNRKNFVGLVIALLLIGAVGLVYAHGYEGSGSETPTNEIKEMNVRNSYDMMDMGMRGMMRMRNMGNSMGVEEREKMEEALEKGDYEEWKRLAKEFDMPCSKFIDSEDEFNYMMEMHERMMGNH